MCCQRTSLPLIEAHGKIRARERVPTRPARAQVDPNPNRRVPTRPARAQVERDNIMLGIETMYVIPALTLTLIDLDRAKSTFALRNMDPGSPS